MSRCVADQRISGEFTFTVVADCTKLHHVEQTLNHSMPMKLDHGRHRHLQFLCIQWLSSLKLKREKVRAVGFQVWDNQREVCELNNLENVLPKNSNKTFHKFLQRIFWSMEIFYNETNTWKWGKCFLVNSLQANKRSVNYKNIGIWVGGCLEWP